MDHRTNSHRLATGESQAARCSGFQALNIAANNHVEHGVYAGRDCP